MKRKKKKVTVISQYEMGGMNNPVGGPLLSIEQFNAMDHTQQERYLNSLSPEDRSQFYAIALKANDPMKDAQLDTSGAVKPQPTLARTDPVAGIKAIPSTNVPPEKKQIDWKGRVDQLKNSLTTVAGVSATMMDMANMANPANTDVKTGAISGAVQGAVGGAALGPLGMIGGGLFGAVTGALKSGAQREAYDMEEEARKKRMFTGLRVAPTMQEEGGMNINTTVPEKPVQMEKGEMMLFEDGRLLDVMAKKTHKEMKSSDVTDIIPTAFIFSNSDKKLIDLEEIADHIMNITRGHYSEDGNVPMEIITMGDTYGKKGKKTPAELAKKVRKETPIVEKPRDEFERRTNIENLQRRADLLRPIMSMQEGVYKEFKLSKPEKYAMGGPNTNCPPGYASDLQGRCYTTDPATGNISYYEPVDENTGPPADAPAPGGGMAKPHVVQGTRKTVTGGAAYPLSPVLVRPSKIVDVPPAAPMIPMAGVQEQPVAKKFESTPAPDVASKLFPAYDRILDQNDARTQTDYAESVSDAERTYQSNRFANLGSLGATLAGMGLNNPTVTPTLQGTEHVAGMFPQISESAVQSQIAPLQKSQNRVIKAIGSSGIAGTQISSAIASTQDRLIGAESGIRNQAVNTNLTQGAKKYAELNRVLSANRAAETEAENATRSNRNQLISGIAGAGSKFIGAQAGLKTSLSERLNELKKWRQEASDQNEKNRLDGLIKKGEMELSQYQKETDRKYIEAGINQLLEKFNLSKPPVPNGG